MENLIKYDFVDKTQGTRYTALQFEKYQFLLIRLRLWDPIYLFCIKNFCRDFPFLLENLFKYSKIFDGRASIKGQVLGSIPDNSKFIEIIGINYGSDGNFYYFQPITLRTEIIRNRDIFFNLGITSDIREFGLSFKNNVISIIHSSYSNSTADNNFIGQILSING